MNNQVLKFENRKFAGTRGVSENAREDRFLPAFLNRSDGRIELSRFRNGTVAPVHMIEGLPREWAIAFDHNGTIARLQPAVISGFVRDGVFYTREELAVLD